ncbi:MAG: class II fructose-bisphosphate aldolase [Patescibacteria group bacterium]
METVRQILDRANREHWAVPHFNISNLEMIKAIAEAAVERRSPALIGTSEGERDFVGLAEGVALVRAVRERYQIPLYINADHSYSVEKAKEAIDAGYDSVHIDLSKKPFEENIAGTREVVEYARTKNSEISIEGEIGYFVTDSSKVYDKEIEVPEESLAKPEEAERFVRETGVHRLAPVVGGIHGVAKNEGKLDIARIAAIKAKLSDTVLVLHGGSGDPAEDLKAAVAAGIANVHISTDLRVAYHAALQIEAAKDEIAPYRIFAPVIAAVKRVCIANMDLFGSSGKI